MATSSKFKIAYEIFAVDRFSDVFNRFTTNTAQADRALRAITYAGMGVTAAGTAVGGAFVYATHQAALFEREMSAVQAVSGATGAEFDQMSERARQLGKDTSFSAHEAAEGMKYLALAGWKTKDILAGIEPVLHLAEAGNMDLGRAADLASDSMAGLGIKAEDTDYYLDRIAQTSRNANTDINMLMEAFKISGGTLSSLNVPLEESSALLGIMANRGFKGAQAGRAMNAIIQNLTTGFGRAGDAMDEINVSAFDSQGNFRGLEATFRDIIKATKDMNEEDRNRIYAMIAGKEHIKTFMAIVNGLGDEYDDLKMKNINANGALKEMRDIMKDNLLGAVERLVSAFKEMAIGIGEALMPAAKAVIEVLIKMIEGFNNLSDETKQTIAFVGVAGAAFTILQGIIITTIASALRFKSALNAMGVSVAALSKLGLRLSGIFGAGLYVAFKAYSKSSKEALDATVDFGDAVSKETAGIADSYMNMASDVASTTQMMADSKMRITEDSYKELVSAQEEFHNVSISNMKEKQRKELERTEEHLGSLEGISEDKYQSIMDKTKEHYDEQIQSTEQANDEIMEIFERAKNNKRGITEEEGKEIASLREQIQADTLASIAQNFDEQIALLEGYGEARKELSAEQAADQVAKSLERKNEIVQQAEEEYDEVLQWAILQRDEIGSISDEEAQNIIDNATRKRDEQVNAVEDAHGKVVAAAQAQAEEHVDLVDWETGEVLSKWDIFKQQFDPLIDGISNVLDTIKPAVKAFGDIFDSVFSTIEDVLKTFIKTMEPLADTVVNSFNMIKDNVEDIIERMSDLWEEHGETIEKVWDAIVKVIEVAISVIGTILSVTLSILIGLIATTMNGILDIISGGLDIVEGLIKIVTGVLEGDWSKAWEGAKQAVSGAVTIIVGIVMTFLGGRLLKILGKIVIKVVKGAAKVVKDTVRKIIEGVPEMIEAASKFFGGLVKGIVKKTPEVLKSLGNLIKDMIKAMKDVVTDFVGIGKDIIGGLVKGILGKMGDAVQAVKEVGSKVKGAAKDFFKIKSPSRVMMEIGEFVSEGLAVGIGNKATMAQRETRKMSNLVLGEVQSMHDEEYKMINNHNKEIRDARKKANDNLEKIRKGELKDTEYSHLSKAEAVKAIEKDLQIELRALSKKHADERVKFEEDTQKRIFDVMVKSVEERKGNQRLSIDQEIRMWNEIKRNTKVGTKLHEDVLSKHQEKVAELRADMTKVNEDYSNKILDIDKKLAEEVNKINDDYTKAFEDRVNSIKNFTGIFDEFEFMILDEGDFLENMRSQVDAVETYGRVIDNLSDKIDNVELMEELRNMGVGSLNELHAINRLTEDQLNEYVALYERKSKEAERLARIDTQPLRESSDALIKDLTYTAKVDMHNVQVEWQKAIRRLVMNTRDEMDSMTAVGRDAVRGLNSGMLEMQSELADTSSKLADTISKTIKQTLRIQSPSRVTKALGEFVGEGMVDGILSEVGQVVKATKKLAEGAIPEMEDVKVSYNLDANTLKLVDAMEGGEIVTDFDSEDLEEAIEDLTKAISRLDVGIGAGGDVNVTIDGKTVETMRHAEDFFKRISQEVNKRRN